MSVAGWMVYAAATATALAGAAWLLERGLARLGLPTRWVWMGSLALCVALPLVAAVDAPPPPDDAPSASGTMSEVIVTVPAGGGPSAGTLGGVDALLVELLGELARWRGDLNALLAATAEALGGGRPRLASWLAVGWGAASALLATILLAATLRLSRQARGWPRAGHLGRDVLVAPRFGPATLGLVRPEIVLPRWAATLSAPRLELILTHEEEHVRARDPLLLALGIACVVALPWNPLLWWQHRRLRDAVEVDCDRRVLRRGAAPPTYGDLLLWMGGRRDLAWLPATTMTGSPSLLERRLAAMKKTSPWAAAPHAIGATTLAGALIVVACTTEPPVDADGAAVARVEAVVAGNPRVADLWVRPDGGIHINDVPYPMDAVTGAIRELDAAAEGYAFVSILADPAVPYGVMDELQKAIRAAGVVRVSFATATEPRRTPPGEPSDVVEGVRLVLPEAGEAEPVSGRNLLHLEVRPSGVVEARLGTSRESQRLVAAEVEGLWRREVASNPRLIAAVKVHPDASYTHMTEVLDALHAAEAQRISIQVLAESEVTAAARPPDPSEADRERLDASLAELRALRDRYADDYPRIQALLREIRALEPLALR